MPIALEIITVVGALTAVFAATIGMTQFDIKRVIAYSTCSQLGYMFFAAGVSAYPAAMFHLTTHAFFRRCCFWVRDRSFMPCQMNRIFAIWVEYGKSAGDLCDDVDWIACPGRVPVFCWILL